MSNLAGYNTINDINLTGTSSLYADDVVIPRINAALTSQLGSEISLANVMQNVNYNSSRQFEIWDDSGTGQILQIDTSLNNTYLSPNILQIYPDTGTYFSCNTHFTNNTTFLENNAVSMDSTSTIVANGATISDLEVSYLDGLTSNIQSQFNSISSNYVTLGTNQTITGEKIFDATTAVGVAGTSERLLQVAGREVIIASATPYVTVANYAFDTPVRTLNTGAVVNFPYTAITGWTFTLLSGSTPTVSTGRGFWDALGPNSYITSYPDYPTVTQSLCIQQNTASSFRLSQSITAPSNGIYSVSFYIWGRYNGYVAQQTITVSVGSASATNIPATEQFWKKYQFETYLVAGANTLNVTFNQTTTGVSGLVFTDIKVQSGSGLTITDNIAGVGNANLLTNYGLSSNSIYNEGPFWNYGNMVVYGGINPLLLYGKNSSVIGTCLYGQNPLDVGQDNIFFGTGIAVNVNVPSSVGNFINVIGIGSGALEQARTATNIIAIGRYAGRMSGSNTSICIGTSAGESLGYNGKTNVINNICIGHESMGYVFSLNNQYNVVIGNQACRTTGDFTNGRSYNTVCGHIAGYYLNSSNHCIYGYNAFAYNQNIASSNNCVFGYNAVSTSTTGQINECTFLGSNANVSVATSSYRNSTAIGAYAIIDSQNIIVLGGLNQSDLVTYPNVVLPSKLTLQSSTLYNAATLNLSVGRLQTETVTLETGTVTTINLPNVVATNVGYSITITRAYIPVLANLITIYTSGGTNIQSADVAPGISFNMDYSIQWIKLTLVSVSGTINWVATYTRRQAVIADTTSNIDYPVSFCPLSASRGEMYGDPSAMTFNPSTETLTVSKVVTAFPIYEKQESDVTVSGASNVTVSPVAGSASMFKFSNMGVGIVTYNLPIITASTVGWRFMVKRMYGSNLNVCTINPNSTSTKQPLIFGGVGAPSIGSTNIGTAQSMFEFVSTVSQVGGFSGTLSNAAGSTTIDITAIPAGNIVFLGGIINITGVGLRTITAYTTGRGQLGTYVVDTAIAGLNTNVAFTSVTSYGYVLTSFN